MSMSKLFFIVILVVVVGLAIALWRSKMVGRPVPPSLRPGQPLPDFEAVDEKGAPVRSSDLRGTATVMLFVRGNWCPFCSSQVENLTVHYKEITDLGARLILVTPKPLETTRRVADFFEVDFEFWLDKDLNVTRELGLLLESGVPNGHRQEYGNDTVWPTALVIGSDGVIRFTALSKIIADRPKPKTLLRELRTAIAA